MSEELFTPSEAVAKLRGEFPKVGVAKLRYLEAVGKLPVREIGPLGGPLYSLDDVREAMPSPDW